MNTAVKELQQISGIGKSIAPDLYSIGIHSVKELQGKDPEKLYLKLCARQGMQIDRCVLYVFRCAVYYASNKKHNPELLKWWNWKDKRNLPPALQILGEISSNFFERTPHRSVTKTVGFS